MRATSLLMGDLQQPDKLSAVACRLVEHDDELAIGEHRSCNRLVEFNEQSEPVPGSEMALVRVK